MIDIHCHILPGIDDGATTLDESIEMARIAAKDGVRTIVATPHIGENLISCEVIGSKVNELNNCLIEQCIPVEILSGGEIISGLPIELIARYSINNNGYVLIEFPHSHLPYNSLEILKDISSQGLRPVLAHPERNPTIVKNPDILVGLVKKTGVGVQITANSINGGFGRKIRSCSRYLLRKRVVHIIGSDAHSTRSRPPGLSEALNAAGKQIGRKNAQKLVYDNPSAVVFGGDIINI